MNRQKGTIDTRRMREWKLVINSSIDKVKNRENLVLSNVSHVIFKCIVLLTPQHILQMPLHAAMTLRGVVKAIKQPCQNSDIKVKILTFEF